MESYYHIVEFPPLALQEYIETQTKRKQSDISQLQQLL